MNDFDDQSKEFFELGEQIDTFLHSEEPGLSSDEMDALSPILQSLDTERYHFTQEQFLTAGGEKQVFKVYDTHADRYVAIASPQRHETKLEREEFLREAQLTAKLQHPNILPIYEVGLNNDGMPYFVMRLLEGEELSKAVRGRFSGDPVCQTRYDLDTLLEIFLKVCDAVIYAHSRGVLHLDLKPSNIMVGRYGLVTLFDWGLAMVVGQDADTQLVAGAEIFDPNLLNNVTCSGTMKGTPGYMAPEQIKDVGQVSARTDVYSLGAVLYFLLTGTIPVKGGDALEVIENTLSGKVMRPRFRRSNMMIPASLGAVAMKALQLEPENRYASVQDLHDEVMRYLRGFSPVAENAGPVKRSQLFMRRHSKVVSVVLLFSMVLTGVVGFSLVKVSMQRAQAEKAREEAVQNLKLYKAETRLSDKLLRDVRAFFKNSIYKGEIWNYALVKTLVKEELGREDIEGGYRANLYTMKGLQYFIDEEFNAAVEAFDQGGYNKGNHIYQRAVAYGRMKPDDEVLDSEQFSELLNMPHRDVLFRKNLFAQSYERHMGKVQEQDPVAYLNVAISMLNVINDTLGWGRHVKLEPRGNGYHLDLSHAPYSTFRLPGSRWMRGSEILLPLNLVSLDLSHSAVKDFHGLKLPDSFEDLILLDVEIYDSSPTVYWLGQLPMKRLFIRPDLFSERDLGQLRSAFEVVEVAPGDEDRLHSLLEASAE